MLNVFRSVKTMFVHKNTRAQFAQHAAAIRGDSSSEDEEEGVDALQVKSNNTTMNLYQTV